MAYTPKTNWQKGEVLEASDMNRVEGGLSDVYTRLDTAATTSITLKAGLQTITSDRDKPFNLTSARGRLLLNLLGRAGNFETLTGWTSAGVTIALNTANAQYGSNCAQITLGSTSGRISRTINTVSGKMYVAAVEIKIGTATNARVDVTGQGNGNTVTSTTGYQISYMRFAASAASHSIGITVTGANGQTVFADGFRVYEVSSTEYSAVTSLTADGFAAKYPYTEGLSGVRNPYAIRWTDNNKSQLAGMLAFDTELLSGVATDADTDAEVLNAGTDGQYYKTSMWRKLALSGDMSWALRSSSTGIKRVQISGLGTGVSTAPQGYMVKYDGQIAQNDVGSIANWTAGDIWQLGDASYNNLIVSIAAADSGWGDNYSNLTGDEIKAYFHGYKMYDSGTYTAAQAQVATSATYNGSGTKQWVNLVGSPVASSLPTTPASGYTPYELMYRRPAAILIPVASEGALILAQGDNAIEIGSGLILRESARPQVASSFYWINSNTSVSSAAKNRVRSFLQVYRNGRPDQWTYSGFGLDADRANYGLQQAQISSDRYNADDTYSITYLAMNYYPVSDIKGVTMDNERAIINDIVRDLEQIVRRLSVNEIRKLEKESSAIWITPTFLNLWSADSNNPAAYRKKDNTVNLTGVVINGTVSNGTVIYRLPDGFKPRQEHHFASYSYQISDGSYGLVEIIIRVNGDVVVGLGGRSYISFAGINFSAV